MQHLSSMSRRRIATALLAAALALPAVATTQTTPPGPDDQNGRSNRVEPMDTPTTSAVRPHTVSAFHPGTAMTAPAHAALFVTEKDARDYWHMLVRSHGSFAIDPRAVASSFIKERLGIDGDAYVVAHFASDQKRMEGAADNVMVLTDALMNAFPDHSRHTFFGALADGVAGLNGGGQSPTALGFLRELATCGSARECFSRAGRFLWSRTGPGYIYNTFIGEGNVIDVVREDARPLDQSFGIYPRSSNFLPENRSALKLSQVIDKFKEEGPFSELPYIKRLKTEFDEYWNNSRTEWPLLARYRFVNQARRALALGTLTRRQYELVMKGGAPSVPLRGSIFMRELRHSPADASVVVRRFDINGYAASDILRFVARDGSEVMYIPGDASPFVTFRNEGELRQWVVRQARRRGSLDELLSHFSIYNGQDGTFRTGVAQGLANLADGRWNADARAIDVANTTIRGDVFEDMALQVEARLRDDARMRTSTAWDAWRTALNRTVAILGPVGYVPPLALPVQGGTALVALGTEIDEGINGRTAAQRTRALENAVMTVVTNFSTAAALHRVATGGHAATPPAGGVAEAEPLLPSPPASDAGAVREEAAQAPAATTPPLSEAQPPASPAPEARIAYSMGAVSPSSSSATLAEQQILVPTNGSGLRTSASDPGERRDGIQARDEDDTASVDFDALGRQVDAQGFIVQRVSNDANDWARRIIDLKKAGIDDRRRRLDDFRTESLTTNQAGYRLSFDHSLVFRVDSRTPADLLRGEGFGPSSEFNDLQPMLQQPSTIGSGSLRASNLVLESWQQGFSCADCRPAFHQYAVWTDRRPVATASDNHDPLHYDFFLDEVHFPADVPVKNIYIVDSADPSYARALANMYQSPFVSTPYGVPLDAFVEYLDGRLDINAPNKLTERRPSALLTPVTPAAPEGTPASPPG